jgi:hypothetical protein
VSHGDGQGERVGQLGLQFGFPGVTAIPIAAAGVSQDENLAGAGIASRPLVVPPVGDGMSGECGSVVRNTHDQGATILGDVVNAIGNGDADGIGTEVVIKNAAGAAFPTTAWVPEVTDQFALLGIDADDGQMTSLEAVAQIGKIFELEVSMGTVAGGNLFVIYAQRIAHLVE